MESETDYEIRMKSAPELPIGSIVVVTEEGLDVPLGTKAMVLEDVTSQYLWPVYEVEWLDDEGDDDFGDTHLAAAFCEVVEPPIKFESVTDVEAFLNE